MSKKVEQIKKRDGRIVPFDETRILGAITKAAEAINFKDSKEMIRLTKVVVEKLQEKYDGHTVPSVEEVQDIIIHTLIEEDRKEIARVYIVNPATSITSVKGIFNSRISL